MDTNSTRIELLMGEQDWRPWLDPTDSFCWDPVRLGVTLRARVPLHPQAGDAPAEPLRGAATDARGCRYWLTAAGELWRQTREGGRPERFWSAAQPFAADDASPFHPVPEHEQAPTLQGLAITDRQYLVAGCTAPAGLLVFDLTGGGGPAWRALPEPFAPTDLSPAPDGGLWLLDSAAGGRVWRLDMHLQPVDASPVSLAGAVAPVAVEGLPDGSFLVLDAGNGTVPAHASWYRSGQDWEEIRLTLTAQQVLPRSAGDVALRPQDCLFLPADGPDLAGELYVLAEGYAQAFVFGLDSAGFTLLPLSVPVGGSVDLRLTRSGGFAWAGDEQAWQPLVAEDGERVEEERAFIIGPIDSGRENCVWHRLMLDAVIPGESTVEVQSRAHDEAIMLVDGVVPWVTEPLPHLRDDGAEVPFFVPFTANEQQQSGAGTWELLFQQARGRHLQLRIIYRTNGLRSPLIRNARIWYPRFSYLTEYLPAVYRENPVSAAFLERYLANPEGINTTLEGRIATAQVYFDPRVTPAEYLDWLASWYGLTLDETWDERRQRLFLAHAPEVFSLRGTLRGVILMVRLATDAEPDDAIFTDDLSAYMGRVPPPGVPAYAGYTVRILEGEGPAPTPPAPEEAAQYHSYLAQVYVRIDALNEAWGTTYASFAEVPVPSEATLLDSAPRRDWESFVGRYLPALRSAHRFRVQVPVFPRRDRGPDPDVVGQVVSQEKPGHTEFRIEPYWAMFRVGEAHVGVDTRLDGGAESVAAVLGEATLGMARIGPAGAAAMRPPVVGRSRVGGASLQDQRSDEIWRVEGTET